VRQVHNANNNMASASSATGSASSAQAAALIDALTGKLRLLQAQCNMLEVRAHGNLGKLPLVWPVALPLAIKLRCQQFRGNCCRLRSQRRGIVRAQVATAVAPVLLAAKLLAEGRVTGQTRCNFVL